MKPTLILLPLLLDQFIPNVQINPDVIDPRKYLEIGKLAMKEEVRKKTGCVAQTKS